jgi:hypothetical protein
MVLTDMIRKILPKRKIDTKTEQMETDTASEKWLQALALLFQACEPLTHDCILTKKEVMERDRSIGRHTFYCLHVKMAIEDGVEPLSWDEWNYTQAAANVFAEWPEWKRLISLGSVGEEDKDTWRARRMAAIDALNREPPPEQETDGSAPLDPIIAQEFGDQLSKMFEGKLY